MASAMHFSLSNCPLFDAQFQLLLLHFLTERILCWLEFTTLKWPHVGEYSTKAEHSLEKKVFFSRVERKMFILAMRKLVYCLETLFHVSVCIHTVLGDFSRTVFLQKSPWNKYEYVENYMSCRSRSLEAKKFQYFAGTWDEWIQYNVLWTEYQIRIWISKKNV